MKDQIGDKKISRREFVGTAAAAAIGTAIVGKAKFVILSFDIKDKYQPRLKRFFNPLN